jgi:glyoxylase-like metal-dependent hydrolase (beta-lactamase superfamily II)
MSEQSTNEGQQPQEPEQEPQGPSEGGDVKDKLYAVLVRMVKELDDGFWPGHGSHERAKEAIEQYRQEEGDVQQ